MAKPKALDLFAGAGGLSLGLRWAGFRLVGAVEIDPDSADTYHQNHPRVRLWREDIRRVACAEILRELGLRKGQLDLVAGCPPCQGFSSLRTKNGRRPNHDSRNDLIMDMARFIRGLRPKAVMLENVPGLARDSRYSSFVQEIRNWGYDVTWKIVDAANFGVPQRRQRLVMLASRVGTVVFPATRPKLLTVRDVIGGLPLPGESNDPLHDIGENRSDAVKQVIALIPKDGGSRKDIADKWQLACHKRMQGFHDVYGRLAWDAVAPTITSGCLNPSKGRFLHPEQDRAITPREAALLQGFPADYWFSPRRGKEHLAVQIGNAFPPEMIRQIARPSAFGL